MRFCALFAVEPLQFKADAHFAVSGGALHVHRFHESAIVVDVNLNLLPEKLILQSLVVWI